MVSFRLTEEEYERLRELCFNNGIGSVSEMARAGLKMLLQQPARAANESLESRVTEVESRVRMLSVEVKKLHSIHPPLQTCFSGTK